MAETGLRVDLRPDDELHVFGPARIRMIHKSGRAAQMRVDAEPGTRFLHVRAGDEPEVEPSDLDSTMGLSKNETIS